MLGWSVVLRVSGGMVRMPTVWTADRGAAEMEAIEWAREHHYADYEVAESSQVEDGSFTKRF